MRDELLKAEDMNVIVVDWAGGSLPLYTQATANTRLVGLELGYFIDHLMVISKILHVFGGFCNVESFCSFRNDTESTPETFI